MSDFFGKLKSGAGKVAFEADKLAKVQRTKMELDQLNRALEGLFAAFGKAVFSQLETGEPVDLEEWRAKIDAQKLKFQAKDRELQIINAENYQQPGAAPAPKPAPVVPPAPVAPVEPYAPPAPVAPDEPYAPPASEVSVEPATVKICPNCGAEVPALSKFCTECGTRV